MNVLIVKLGSVGDIVHTLPALAALKKRFPEARIDWVVERRARDLLVGHPYLDRLVEVDTLAWRRRPLSPATWRAVAASVRRLRERRYDVVFDFQGLAKSALVTRLARAARRVGFARTHAREPVAAAAVGERLAPPPELRHVVDRNLYLLRAVGIETQERAFAFPPAGPVEGAVDAMLARLALGPFVALGPGGGWPTKRWPAERFGSLAAALYDAVGLRSLVLWGPGERELAERVAAASAGRAVVAPPTSLLELAVLLRRARLFVGGDTGPMHLASASGVPVVALFGPTDPERHGPAGRGGRVVWKAVPCSPCHKRSCPVYDLVCLESMGVDEVLDAALRRLGEEESPKTATPPGGRAAGWRENDPR